MDFVSELVNYSSSNLLSIKRVSFSKTCDASSPFAVIRIVVPLTAASINKPMIDFPDTFSLSLETLISLSNLLVTFTTSAAATFAVDRINGKTMDGEDGKSRYLEVVHSRSRTLNGLSYRLAKI